MNLTIWQVRWSTGENEHLAAVVAANERQALELLRIKDPDNAQVLAAGMAFGGLKAQVLAQGPASIR